MDDYIPENPRLTHDTPFHAQGIVSGETPEGEYIRLRETVSRMIRLSLLSDCATAHNVLLDPTLLVVTEDEVLAGVILTAHCCAKHAAALS